MKNIIKLYYIYIGIVFVIALFLFFELPPINLNISLIKELSPILSALAAIINLIFVVTIFTINKKDKTRDENLARQSYWYRNIIIDQNIDNIHKVFEKLVHSINSIVKSNCDDDKLKEVIDLYQSEKRFLIMKVDDMIRILDNLFAEKLDILLDDFEDSFTEKIEDLFTCSDIVWETKMEEVQQDLNKMKQDFIHMLYEYEIKGYKIVEKE